LSIPERIRKQVRADALGDLENAVNELSNWTSKLPSDSLFYLNDRVTIHSIDSVSNGASPIDIITADILFDIHSFFSSQCLLKSWRADQLSKSLAYALENWNLTMAAAAARALVETASAWTIESREVISVWASLKKKKIKTPNDIMVVRDGLLRATTQLAWATRISAITSKSGKALQRTNVLTLVQKAAKHSMRPQLLEEYEILCDAVHPSWGAGECFWREAGRFTQPSTVARINWNRCNWMGNRR
jgi:hypothetical protein